MAQYFASKTLSGRRKKPPREEIDDQRYRYLGLEHAEPDLGDPLVGPSSEGANPIKSGDQYIVVAVKGYPGERFWIPNQGGLIPGSISIFDENSLVGSLSSVTQLDFRGAGVKATTSTVKKTTITLGGNFSFSADQIITQVGNTGVTGIVEFSTSNSGIVTLTSVNGSFNTSGELKQNDSLTGVTPSSLSVLSDPSIRAEIEVTPEFFSEDRQFIFNDNDEFNGALNLTYNQLNGYVGVGTTSATQMLHIQGSMRLTDDFYDANNFNGDPGDILAVRSDEDGGGLIWIDQGDISPNAGGIRGSVQYHNILGQIDGAPNFVFNDVGGVNNVGIGSTLPQVDLDVVGIVSVTGNVRAGTLDVPGISTFRADVDIDADVDIRDTLTVNGTSTFNNPVSIDDTTESSNSTTGALKVAGGVGIAKTVHIGESLNLLDDKKINIGLSSDLQIYHSTSGAGSSSFIDNITGDIYIRNNVDNDDGGNIYLQAKSGENGIIVNDDGKVELYHDDTKRLETNSNGVEVFDTLTADIVNIRSTTAENVTATGQVTFTDADITMGNFTAGLGTIRELDVEHTDTDTLNVGIAGTIAKLTVDNVEIDGNTIKSTSGNLGLSAPVNNFISIDKGTKITDTTEFSSLTSSAALIVSGGVNIDKKLNVDGDVTFTSTTESANISEGALKISGGVAINKQLNVAGITSITNTTSSTSSITGAFTVSGGVGILGDLNIGGSVGFGSTAVPSVNNQHDFGTASKQWNRIYARDFIGDLTGSAEKTDITADSTDTNRFIFLSDVSGGTATAFGDTDFIYNPSINALGIATDRFDSAVSSTNTGKIAVGIVTAFELYGALRGNADTATKLLNARDFSISGDGDAPTISFDGTQNVAFQFTLDTVNTSEGVPQSGDNVSAGASFGNTNGVEYPVVTVNKKGLVTAIESVFINEDDITSGESKNIAITEQTDSGDTHYIHFGDVIDTDLGDPDTYDRVNVDSSELVYVPNTGVGIGSTAPTQKLDVGGTTRTTILEVTETSTFLGRVDIDADVDIQDNLIVGGATTLANNGGITTTGGDLYVGRNLFVKDDIFYDEISGKNMVVTGIATINQLEVGQPDDTLVGITSILDENDMISDSDTALATQQSIKKYVDVTVDANNDLEFVGNIGIGTVDLFDQQFSVLGTDNEIETSASEQTLRIGLPDNVTITGNLTVNGNTTLGDAASDTLSVNAKLDTNVLPATNATINLGAETLKFSQIYSNTIYGSLSGTASQSDKIKISQEDTDTECFILFAKNNPNDSYQTPCGDDDLKFDSSNNKLTTKNLLVNSDTTFGDDNTGIVTFNAKIGSTILPTHDATAEDDSDGKDIGAANERFRVVHAFKFSGQLGGNADTATKLKTARAIAINSNLKGDNAGKVQAAGVNFDGSQDISLDGRLMNSGVKGGVYGDTAIIPKITVNDQGVITAVSPITANIPRSQIQLDEGNELKLLFVNGDSNAGANNVRIGYANGFRLRPATDAESLVQMIIDPGPENTETAGRIHVHGGSNQNTTILRVTANAQTFGGVTESFPYGLPTDLNYFSDHGFSIRYMGSRSGNANALSIFTDNGSAADQIEAINILQNGNTGFGVVEDRTLATEHDIPETGGGVVTVGKLKARDIEIIGDIIVNAKGEILSFTDLDDTPSGYKGFKGQMLIVNDNEDALEFITIEEAALQGEKGQKGVQGNSVKGQKGVQGNSVKGQKGVQGNSVKGQKGVEGNSVKGQKGVEGNSVKGAQGQKGVEGNSVKGAQGQKGASGDTSAVKGEKGAPFTFDDFTEDQLESIKGSQGQGIKGSQGQKGASGSGGGSADVTMDDNVTDILSISDEGVISADDAGDEDKLVFWDNSESKLTYLTAGSGLSISGTTITASGGTTYKLKVTQDSAGTNNSDNTDPYLFLDASSGTDDSVQLAGTGSVSVTRNNKGKITIDGGDFTLPTIPTFAAIELRNGSGAFIDWKNTDGDNKDDYDIRLDNFSEYVLNLTAYGSNTAELKVEGNITAFTSDIRLKTDVEPIKNALEKVQSIRGFTYSHNETAKELGFKDERRWSGVSAQEIEKILPEAVFPAPVDNKYLTVQYEKLVPLLIEAIKELKTEVDDLRSQIQKG